MSSKIIIFFLIVFFPSTAFASDLATGKPSPASRRTVKIISPQKAKAQTQYLNSQFTYTYDNVGDRLTETVLQNALPRNLTYTYDNFYQLTGVTGSQTHSYQYDPSGNRTTVNDTPYTVNNLNQYTSVGGTPYTFDPNGNLTSDGINTYTYDYENRLISVTGPSLNVTYAYDGFGRRIKKSVNGVITYYLHDGDQVIEERGSGNVLQSTYTYGPGIDEVLTMNRNAQTFFYFYDGLGSVTDLTTAQGEMVESYSYDPYGMPSQSSSVGNPYFYTGRPLDPETNLYYYRNRYYHPGIGRFISREAEPTDFNIYRYVLNSPINWIDPWGTTTFSPGIPPINFEGPMSNQGSSIPIDISPPLPPLPPFEPTPSIHQPPGPDILPQPAPGTEAGNKGRSGKPVGVQGSGSSQGSGANLAQAGGKATKLPIGGKRPFIPKKQKGGQIPRDHKGRFIDRQGNKWEWDPRKQEWDVQHRDGSHTNINSNGEITHGPDSFPR